MTSPFTPYKNPSSFRRIAAASWKQPNDATIYGNAEMDMTKPLALLQRLKEQGTDRVTMTHLVAKALAMTLAKFPEVNARVRFWGKLELRKTVDIFMQVAADSGRDLSGYRLASADKVPLADFARGARKAAEDIRSDADPKFKKSRSLIAWLPWWILRPFLSLGSFLTNELNLDLAGSGMPVDPFGTAMVTSLGMYGVDEAYAPLLPISRCMMILLVPAIREKVVVVDGQMVIRPMLKLCATFDHRMIDGVTAAKVCVALREALEQNPEQLIA